MLRPCCTCLGVGLGREKSETSGGGTSATKPSIKKPFPLPPLQLVPVWPLSVSEHSEGEAVCAVGAAGGSVWRPSVQEVLQSELSASSGGAYESTATAR